MPHRGNCGILLSQKDLAKTVKCSGAGDALISQKINICNIHSVHCELHSEINTS